MSPLDWCFATVLVVGFAWAIREGLRKDEPRKSPFKSK